MQILVNIRQIVCLCKRRVLTFEAWISTKMGVHDRALARAEKDHLV